MRSWSLSVTAPAEHRDLRSRCSSWVAIAPADFVSVFFYILSSLIVVVVVEVWGSGRGGAVSYSVLAITLLKSCFHLCSGRMACASNTVLLCR